MNITDVMRIVDWKFQIQEATHWTNQLITEQLYCEFNKYSCEVTYLQVGLQVFDDLDSIETYNKIAMLIGSKNVEESIRINIEDADIKTINEAAALKNLTQSQFIMSAIISKLESLND